MNFDGLLWKIPMYLISFIDNLNYLFCSLTFVNTEPHEVLKPYPRDNFSSVHVCCEGEMIQHLKRLVWAWFGDYN